MKDLKNPDLLVYISFILGLGGYFYFYGENGGTNMGAAIAAFMSFLITSASSVTFSPF